GETDAHASASRGRFQSGRDVPYPDGRKSRATARVYPEACPRGQGYRLSRCVTGELHSRAPGALKLATGERQPPPVANAPGSPPLSLWEERTVAFVADLGKHAGRRRQRIGDELQVAHGC